MVNKFKSLVAAAAIAVVAPVAATAATISGQVDITGFLVDLDNSNFSSTGNVDFVGADGTDGAPFTVASALGDFSAYISTGDTAAVYDIDFNSGGTIWEVGGFTFASSTFVNFIDSTAKKFTALGTISGNGYESDGVFNFTAQGETGTISFSSTTTTVPVPAAGLLLLAGIGALGVAGRRKAA